MHPSEIGFLGVGLIRSDFETLDLFSAASLRSLHARRDSCEQLAARTCKATTPPMRPRLDSFGKRQSPMSDVLERIPAATLSSPNEESLDLYQVHTRYWDTPAGANMSTMNRKKTKRAVHQLMTNQ